MLFRGIALLSVLMAAGFGFAGVFAGALMPLALVGVFFVSFFSLSVAALLFLLVICDRVDTSQEVEQESKFYRSIMYVYVEALMDLVLVRLKTKGLEKTPKEGRFLLVCNHLFLADPGILLHCFQKSQLTFISKQENLDMPVIGKFMHAIRCQLIDRDDDRQALKAILKCIQMIKKDECSVAVFPEGYTSKDGKLHHFRSGVFKIAQKAEVPIVVCTIQGTREIFHNLKKLKRTPVELHLVDVIPAEELKGKNTVEIADRVYEMMIADLGEAWRAEE